MMHSQRLALLEPPDEILNAFRRRDWDSVTRWIDIFPLTTTSHQDQDVGEHPSDPKALRFAILYQAPIDVIRKLSNYFASSILLEKSHHFLVGETVVTYAMVVACSTWETVQVLLEASPAALVVINDMGETPLYIAWKWLASNHRQPGGIDPILQMLESYARDQWNRRVPSSEQHAHYTFSPLHAAAQCSDACPDSLFYCLRRRHPEGLLQHDSWGRTPLHWLLVVASSSGGNNHKKIQRILQVEPRAVTVRETSTGYLPLHLAVLHPPQNRVDTWWDETMLPLLQQTPQQHHHHDHLPLFTLAPTVDLTFRLLRYDLTALEDHPTTTNRKPRKTDARLYFCARK